MLRRSFVKKKINLILQKCKTKYFIRPASWKGGSACRKSCNFRTVCVSTRWTDFEKSRWISFSCEWVLYDGTAPEQKTKNAQQRKGFDILTAVFVRTSPLERDIENAPLQKRMHAEYFYFGVVQPTLSKSEPPEKEAFFVFCNKINLFTFSIKFFSWSPQSF